MEPHDVDNILRQLGQIAAHQDALHETLFEYIRGVQAFTRQQVAINADVKTTLARIEALLACMIQAEHNGREA